MAKSKKPRKVKPMKVTINGETYDVACRNGNATVYASRTAKGQLLVVGVYNIENDAWHNDDILPSAAKKHIAKLMSQS